MKSTSKAGFSLLEMLVVVAILSLILGVVFTQVSNVQKVKRGEDMKLDLTQEGREFVDTFIRDIHQTGYPNAAIYAAGVLGTPPENDSRVAVGLVKFAYDEVRLESGINGDGSVYAIDYKLETDASGSCPCKISRSQVTKSNGVAPMSQPVSYTIELQDVINSGGANGGATGTAAYSIAGTSFVGGASRMNDTYYSEYKTANVFTAYDAAGNVVAPADYSTAAGINALRSIKKIQININLMARNGDMQTGRRAVIPFVASGSVGNN